MATWRCPTNDKRENPTGQPAPGSIELGRPAAPAVSEIRTGSVITDDYPRHWHEELQICAVTAGAGYLRSGGRSYFTPCGTLFFVPPGQVHSNRTIGPSGVSFSSMYFRAAHLRAAAAELAGRPSAVPDFATGVTTDRRTRGAFLALHRALRAGRPADALVSSFLLALVARHSVAPPAGPSLRVDHSSVRRVRDYLRDNCTRPVSLAELARLVSESPFHLHRAFCRVAGMPPHAYHLQVRIVRARALLLENHRIADVALATGFTDQAHFTRHFKRLMAVTPGEYLGRRKNVQDRSGGSCDHAGRL